MKKQFFFMLSVLAIALPLSLSLQSCGDDDDDPQVINTDSSGGDTGNNGTGGNDTGGDNTGGNAPEAIDLGLPSGIKWASCNLGANYPEQYGYYYAWGETETKENYSPSTSTTYGKTVEQLKAEGIVGSDGNLTPAYDVAHVKLGDKWRLPTFAEIQELLNNCTWTWTTQNGVKGRLVTSKTNGNSIFLPAAGRRYEMSIRGAGDYGDYWSSTPYESYSSSAYSLDFISNDIYWSSYYWRYDGHSVRPVSE